MSLHIDNNETNITRQLQLRETEIAKTILDICKKHNLRCFGWFGTAIGAVRHKGFIPWDEDLDLVLPRPDYENLIQILQEELPAPLEVLENAGKYRLEHIVIHDTSTTFIDHNRIKWPAWYRGIFVDIFPLDGFPENPSHRKRFMKALSFLNKLRTYHRYDITGCPTWKSKAVYLLFSLKVILPLRESLIKKYSYESAAYAGFTTEIFPERYLHKKELFEQIIEVPFENISMPIPQAYDELLTQEYGDYMTPPPEKEREVYSEGGIVDFEKSFRYYLQNPPQVD